MIIGLIILPTNMKNIKEKIEEEKEKLISEGVIMSEKLVKAIENKMMIEELEEIKSRLLTLENKNK